MMNTSQKGLVSQTAVLNRLVQLGFEVLLPWDPALGYDLAYSTNREERHSGFSVYRDAQLVRIQVKTARLSSDGSYLEFNTFSVVNGKKKAGVYIGKAEYFAVYSPDTGKVYMIAVDGAPKHNMNLRFKSAGVVRAGRNHSYRIPYSEEIADDYYWAEDYEL